MVIDDSFYTPRIASVEYFTAASGVLGQRIASQQDQGVREDMQLTGATQAFNLAPAVLSYVVFCVITLNNGYCATGCYNPTPFSTFEELQGIAQGDARNAARHEALRALHEKGFCVAGDAGGGYE